MEKINRDFFKGNEILFVGYSSRNKAFCSSIVNAMTKNGFKVYPLNTKTRDGFDVKVYQDFDQLPKVPDTAYVLLKGSNARNMIRPLKDRGVRRILFQNGQVADQETLKLCGEMGIETAVGCPMMLFGSGIHRIHGFFAGVKK